MKYRLVHTTEFHYDAIVGLCYNEARLLPRSLPYQKVFSPQLHINPFPTDQYRRFDYFGNQTNYFSIQQPHEKLVVTAKSVIQLVPEEIGVMPADITWESVRDTVHGKLDDAALAASEYTLDSPKVKVDSALKDYAASIFVPQRPIKEAIEELTRRIYTEFKYDPEFTSIATPIKEVMEQRRGVCQDFAHLAIGCLRALGLAARYVSGYIETIPPEGEEKLVGADASHAWFSVFVPGSGWFDYDPTNNQSLGEKYITLAWGRDFSDVTPLKGVAFGSGEHELKVSVDVTPLP